ncbi:hypothetical protein V1512DRAFT_78578 [Lipomyces arxii]|uniref:uncharacterized protein n=1 Tax=Lipomyces arxii TaxID=56418 RepID=UPI0034CD7706
MFRKKPGIKPFAPVRSSDRRKLLAQILETFNLSADTLLPETKEAILPTDIQIAKYTAHATGETGFMYVGGEGNRPIWLKLRNDRLIPTVFLLWRCPFLLPIVHTWSPVIEKLRNGADMMLPGLIPPFDPSIHKGSVVSIASADRPTVPLAVGVCDIDLAKVTKVQGEHGKAVLVVQCYGDEIPIKGKISVPLELDLEVPKSAAEDSLAVETKTEGVGSDADEVTNAVMNIVLFAKFEETLASAETVDVPAIQQVEQRETDGRATAEIDKAFRLALLSTIHEAQTQTPLTFPQPSSTFMSAHILKHLPLSFASMTMKQTSWKKAVKFFKAMEKEGLLKCKERGGDVTVTSIAGLEHPDVKAFKEFQTAGRKKSSSVNYKASFEQNSSGGEGKLLIKEYYQLHAAGLPIATALGKRSSDYFAMTDLRAMLLEYISKEELINPQNPREVNLNPVLSHMIPSSPKPKVLVREALLDRFRETCSPFYRILRQNEEERSVKLVKGTPPKIHIAIAMKQGHKVTRISNFEVYRLDAQDLANELRTECASSTTVNKTAEGTKAGGQSKLEIQIQGPQSKTCVAVLERHGVRNAWIDVKDISKKGR